MDFFVIYNENFTQVFEVIKGIKFTYDPASDRTTIIWVDKNMFNEVTQQLHANDVHIID